MALPFIDLLDDDIVRPHEKIIVGMNDVKIAFWPPATSVHYLATGYLNSCTAIGIISPEAGILAHIAPLPPGSTLQSLAPNPEAAQANAQVLLNSLGRLYVTHRSKFDPSRTFVVAGIFRDSPAMAGVLRMINQFCGELGLPVSWKQYNVIGGRQRPEGHTSVIIHASPRGAMPVVYQSTLTEAITTWEL